MEMTPVQAIKAFFGTKSGESLTDFMKELKELSPEDKQWMAEESAKALDATLKSA